MFVANRRLVLGTDCYEIAVLKTVFATLRRHPIPIRAFFRYSLVLTYAFPKHILVPLLPAGLTVDSYEDTAFLAIALGRKRSVAPGRPARISGTRFFSVGGIELSAVSRDRTVRFCVDCAS